MNIVMLHPKNEMQESMEKLNPYKTLYIYLRNAYIANYYRMDFPSNKMFDKYIFSCLPLNDSDVYSLRDVAKIFAVMNKNSKGKNSVDSKYEAIKKCFQKSKYMDNYKINGEYEFRKISIPLAYYIYYRVKKREEPTFEYFWATDENIVYRTAPLLEAKMRGDANIYPLYQKFTKFIAEQLSNIFKVLESGYQVTMIDELCDVVEKINYRLRGMDSSLVYRK